jgi:hypothetical protein
MNPVDHAVVADADTPQVIGIDQARHTWRPGVIGQGRQV